MGYRTQVRPELARVEKMKDSQALIPDTPPRLLLLDPADNVLVSLGAIAAGEPVRFDGETYVTSVALDLGHKLARRPIAKGEPVTKLGATIGLAGRDIDRGEHVHLHNLVSQYTVIEDMEK